VSNNRLRDKYFEALGLQPGSDNASKQLAAALARAHDIREFEIEHATYFWAFQVAAFTAFALFWRDKPSGNRPLSVAFAGIGLLIALSGWLSARGFWQENWEKHIDLLEDSIEGRLHKTVWIGARGLQFSVSRINEKLNVLLTVFWLGMLLVAAIAVLEIPVSKPPTWLAVGLSALTLMLAARWLWRTRSKLSGDIYGEEAVDWQPYCSMKTGKFQVLRRYAPGEGRTL